MSKKNDGGGVFSCYAGMSLRDFYAGLSLLGTRSRTGSGADSENAAWRAYKDADAMLEERSKNATR